MKSSYDKSHRFVEFQVGDKVLLRLHPYRQISVAKRKNQKLSPRFFGPFTILERIGSMAYRLDLPLDSRLHSVFHVSCLKQYHEGLSPPSLILPSIPPVNTTQPSAILDYRVKGGIPKILVHWSHSSPADASWEPFHSITDKFPEFQLEDKLPLGRGSNVTKPLQVYTRYGHGSKAIHSKQPLIELLN
ncbi:hypothetical protein K2173_015526 [Erythroxylum novogranatense]|uniref:Tf2-1-like SH3-like domain-containing protein n=1 Tax=Erythroxylum novogranatense TaxID=1862640 RepID=A0AAV8SSN0_9ROSI|nr:hypothetical protein K2173_015526 [Erythroxylum novogranatense]